MPIALVRSALALVLLALAGCISIAHNVPGSSPISAGSPPRLALYADANGHLYPDVWSGRFPPEAIEREHSLLRADASGPDTLAFLIRERQDQLDRVAERLRDVPRVFILVHGFNNNHAEARHAFDVVRDRLPLRPSDGVVEFHWDGLSSPDRPGQMAMWFNAVGYSQVAGTQALRGLLRRLPDKHIVIVAHSRGTSVTLSALSNPSFSRRFLRRTREILTDDVFPADPLPEGARNIDLLFLAPAIGFPDFWKEQGPRDEGCDRFRHFPRVRSLHYSLNEDDPVLRKVWAPLASRFNATDLGRNRLVGEALARCYDGAFVMRPHPFLMPEHSFIRYALHSSFPEMIAAAGLGGGP